MKQPIKKKEFKKPNISDIREKLGLTIKSDADLVKSAADKPLEFIVMPKPFMDAVKIPGFPKGYLSIITGWSNTGKSTLKNCLIASCINSNILPVIFETENNFDFNYAIDCGVKATPVYGDVEVEDIDMETGEISYHTENRIINYEGNFIYMDNKILADMYGDIDHSQGGKKVSTKRKVAVIEDIAYAINSILDMQDNGDIQQEICFIWDSIGSIGSYKSFSSKVGNNMFDAGSIAQAFNSIINDRIPSSKKISEPYTNTFVCINKIWNDSMNSVSPGVPSIELKGGKTMFYGARFILHLGGVAKAATKKLEAEAKGQKYVYGTQTKISVTKNQLPTPYNVTYKGELCCVHNGILNPKDLAEYKKEYMKDILFRLETIGGKEVSEGDITFSESDSDE